MVPMRTPAATRTLSNGSEALVKAAYLNGLRRAKLINARTVLASELVLGRSGVRADLAILSDRLIGVEIKTERDTLRRLSRQLIAYRAHCDQVVLILADKHLRARELPPVPDVELWRIMPTGGVELVRTPQEARPPSDLATLLTAVELGRVTRTLARRRRVPDDLEHRLALFSLRARFSQSSAQFWRAVGRAKIRSTDLVHLSRFHLARREAAELRDQEARRWEAWERQAQQVFSASSAVAA